MCPPNTEPHTHEGTTQGSPSATDDPPTAASRNPPIPAADELQRELDRVPRAVLAHVLDVHCHPTDSNFAMTVEAAKQMPTRVCAMATRRSDQQLVADLARAHPARVLPCFGYHPWFYHWISVQPAASKEEHYRALFLPTSIVSTPQQNTAFERLLPFLPDPTPLSAVLADLRARLTEFPTAMLGEVGIDRVCRIPYSYPADPPYAEQADNPDDAGSDAPRELSPFTIPLEHQLAVLEAQLALAVELGRNVSLHSVKCQATTGELLDRMKARHGPEAWLRISVDLHSCGLSPQTWQQISKHHPNVFLSLSTVINARSPSHRALAAACAPDRILVESDFNDLRLSAPYTWHMLQTIAAAKGWRVEDAWDDSYADAPETEWGAVRRLEENWKLFERGEHKERVRGRLRRDRAIEEWEATEEST
ncbi:TatD DNase family Scn1 [Lenzites betulinus]|nr:TatD DNase family Scn1 [Lenzites betulinus]